MTRLRQPYTSIPRGGLEAAICVVLFLATAAAPCASAGQTLYLPVELGEGVLITDSSPTPFTASARFHPSIGFGSKIRVGANLIAAYANPGISAQVGARADALVKDFVLLGYSGAQVRIAAEAAWGTRDRNPVGGAVILSLSRVIQLTLRSGYDAGQEAPFLGTALGTDLSFWLGINARPPSPRERVRTLTGCSFNLFVAAKIRALASLEDDEGNLNEQMIERLERFLRDEDVFVDQPDLEEASKMLDSAGLDMFATQLNDSISYVRRSPGCEEMNFVNIDTAVALRSAVEAWRVSIDLAEAQE